MCHRIFCKGLEIGNCGYWMNKNAAGALVTDTRRVFGAGWSKYWKHLGGTHDHKAAER